MLTMAPLRRSIMSGMTNRASRNGAVRSTASIARQWLSLKSLMGTYQLTAALLTSTSTGPKAACASSIRRWQSSSFERSTCTACALPPASVISLAVPSNVPGRKCCPSLSVRAATTTLAPSRANNCAMAAPMPRLAPVTTATLPSSCPAIVTPLYSDGSAGVRRTRLSEVKLTYLLVGANPMSTIPQAYRDLLDKVVIVHLATLMPNDSPHVSPVWFEYAGDRVRVNSAAG